MWWQAQENDPLPLCHLEQLWIQVGLMTVHDKQQWAILNRELQEMPEKPLPKQLTFHAPCRRRPIERIGDPLLLIGAPWISPLKNDERGDILSSRINTGQDGDVVPGSLGLSVGMLGPPGHGDLSSCGVQLKPRLVAVVDLTGFLLQPMLLQGGSEETEVFLDGPLLNTGCPSTVNEVWGKAIVVPLPEIYPPRLFGASGWRRL